MINLVASGLIPQRGPKILFDRLGGDSQMRSHLCNRQDALGQGQISHLAASSSQEIVPDPISFDKLIIQGTRGGWCTHIVTPLSLRTNERFLPLPKKPPCVSLPAGGSPDGAI